MLTRPEVQRLSSSRALGDFFHQSLGYQVNPVPFDAEDLGIPAAPARLVHDVELLCDYQKQFQVYRLEVTSLRRTDLPAILEPFYRKHPAGNYLFVCTEDYREFAFVSPVRVSAGDDPTKTKLLLRILRVDRTNVYHSDLETLDHLRLTALPLSPQAIWNQHRAAFDVQRVTDDFFTNYEACFYQEVRPAVMKTLGNEDEAHHFTQLLFNRLMFCWFLQKKGWLGGDPNYLLHLLERANRPHKGPAGRTTVGNFYHDYLSFLFFEVLSNPEEKRRKHYPTDPEVSREAPFLNGGLFERPELDERVEAAPRLKRLPNAVFQAILRDLFARYNFTVEESTSLDVQVALDPELLGTIFERLVTDRHETGSYYTPRPVVEFMCREALARYVAQASRLPAAIVEDLVYHHRVAHLSPADAPEVIQALDRIRICDPACGSGAYLVAMLHELVAMYRALYSEALRDPRKDYDLKLRLIERNLYGVDIDPFAVHIARLRLWLSLVVDNEETDWRQVKPLPNLDFKIAVGDSLTAPDPQAVPDLFRAHAAKVAAELARLKADFLRETGERKGKRREEIEQRQAELAELAGTFSGLSAPPDACDWRVAFAEVFTPPLAPPRQRGGEIDSLSAGGEGRGGVGSGFDLILANPPYVRADERPELLPYRAALKASGIYQTLYEKWDLYIPFLERGYQLLRPGGRLVFIISDAYNAAQYARKSHEFFLKNARIERIDFCSDLPLFEAGVSNTIVHFAKATPDADHQPIRVRHWGETRDDFERHAEVLPTAPQAEFGAALFKPSGQKPMDSAEGFVPLTQICYISYGLRANADDRYWKGEFVTDDLVSEIKDKKHPKPFIEGKDLVRWWIRRVRYLEAVKKILTTETRRTQSQSAVGSRQSALQTAYRKLHTAFCISVLSVPLW